MSLIDDALGSLRLRLQTALYNQPELRAALSIAQLAGAADTAIAEARIRQLLEGLQVAQAVAEAVAADVPTPPPSVAGALDDFDVAAVEINEFWGIFPP